MSRHREGDAEAMDATPLRRNGRPNGPLLKRWNKVRRLSVNDLYKLAGLLEGEGCFTRGDVGYPVIKMTSTDRDVVQWVADAFGIPVIGPYFPGGSFIGKKMAYKCEVKGSRAAGFMMTLYLLLFSRRRARIRELLAEWRNRRRLEGARLRAHQTRVYGDGVDRHEFIPANCHPDRRHLAQGLCGACYQRRGHRVS